MKNQKSHTIIYHHNDLDGRSAAAVLYIYGSKYIDIATNSFFEMGYNDKMDKHSPQSDVFILDLSISESTYAEFINVCKTARSVTWIDHHASSVDVIKNHFEELQSQQNLLYFVKEGACGALLTYCYCKVDRNKLMETVFRRDEGEFYSIELEYSGTNEASVSFNKFRYNSDARKTLPRISDYYSCIIHIPQFLVLVSDFDCWTKKYTDSNYLNFGLESVDTRVVSGDETYGPYFNSIWDRLLANDYQLYISRGKTIQRYLDNKYSKELKMTFEWEFEGTKFLCKNASENGSFQFLDLIKRYPAVISFRYNGEYGLWEYSVYSDESSRFDCKKFCEKFGGGGHIHAAGFSSKDLIFNNYKASNK